MGAEAAGLGEQLDRAEPVLGDALLDLARLLAGVHVQRQFLARRVGAELLEPVARAGAHGVGGKPDPHAYRPYCLELHEVVSGRRLSKAVEPAAPVGGEQEHELDPSLGGSLDGSVRLGQPEVMELADRRVAGGPHLPVDVDVVGTNPFRRQPGGQVQHGIPPPPEVLPLDAAAQGPLEAMAVGVHKPRQRERFRHLRILSAWLPARCPRNWR